MSESLVFESDLLKSRVNNSCRSFVKSNEIDLLMVAFF